ncbi:hypothetical protein I6I08_04290 [Actinomyces oris]|uniref:Uncharacterized protein n=1 Tax=Actinomyces oris TaxID=544580 RepID=A0A508BQB8_9ACTO|nr:hypothetical protein [Actinomyces oris]QQC40502.1 hypothetical protein I6I08_04290 [Actinomyces oris]TQD60352.1 hypothetical protein FK267_07860 [Actinomyces oris]
MSHNFQEVIDELHRGRDLLTSTSGTQGRLNDLSAALSNVCSRVSTYCSDAAQDAAENLATAQGFISNITRGCITAYNNANEELILRLYGQAVSNTSRGTQIDTTTSLRQTTTSVPLPAGTHKKPNQDHQKDNKLTTKNREETGSSLAKAISLLTQEQYRYMFSDPRGDAFNDSTSSEDLKKISRLKTIVRYLTESDSSSCGWLIRIIEGRIFNLENVRRYQLNEIHVTQVGARTGNDGVALPKQSKYNRVDSISIHHEQVVERKHSQISEISFSTWKQYVDQLANKYTPGDKSIVIADTPSNREKFESVGLDPDKLIGKSLKGIMILEIPEQDDPPPPEYLAYAAERHVTIWDTRHDEWKLSDDGKSSIKHRNSVLKIGRMASTLGMALINERKRK